MIITPVSSSPEACRGAPSAGVAYGITECLHCDVLRDAGVSSIDYVEQLSFLLFLKMADERAHNPLRPEQVLPPHLDISWNRLARLDGDALENEYRRILTELGKEPTNLGVVFRKAQNRVQEPALLRKLIVDLIGTETWSVGGDVNGDAYEALLERSATDIKSGAGQYFTPRPLVRTMGRGVAADTGRHQSSTRRAVPAASCSPRSITSNTSTARR